MHGEVGAMVSSDSLSIVMPAKNEADTIANVVNPARRIFVNAEIIVVDDGSSDKTAQLASDAGAQVISHPVSLGNGAAVKTGVRAAKGDVLVLMDGDGQHSATEIPPLLELLDRGYGMIVGARDSGSHANVGRLFANGVYNGLASLISGHRILDLTSGFRAVRASQFKQFLYLLPNGFSYPTTITMAFLRSGYPVGFVPINASKRTGRSHIKPIRDGVRFLAIIFKIATLYSPLKVFLPVSAAFFVTGLGYYAYTFMTMGRFTNMSLLVFSASVIVFLIGLVSEQVTALMYSKT
jgi:glycosyltransferase involved in cell wall biosynthesis